mmetsp:Transcript_31909/g.78275  ORF Transcript_31909/g.78275 Transcript_31909/m.78275 type:complete len:126 (+) Transcript_31909:296-673(+)
MSAEKYASSPRLGSAGSSSSEESPARRSPGLEPRLPDMRSLRSTWSSFGSTESDSPFRPSDFSASMRSLHRVPHPDGRGAGSPWEAAAGEGSPVAGGAPNHAKLLSYSSSYTEFLKAGYAEQVLM